MAKPTSARPLSHWSKAEQAILAKCYATSTQAQLLAKPPGRTWRAIRRRAHTQQVSRRETYDRHLKWTPEELAILRRLYPTQGSKAAHLALPRFSWQAIRQEASKLGLKAPPRPKKPVTAKVKLATQRREARSKKQLTPKVKVPKVVKPPKPAALPKVRLTPIPKPLPPIGLNDRSPKTPNANAGKALRKAKEEAKKLLVPVTAEELRRLPANHPARVAYTIGARTSAPAAYQAFHEAMNQLKQAA